MFLEWFVVLVVSAVTGNVGTELAALLRQTACGPWRMISRHPPAELAGVQARSFDFDDPATWAPALEDVTELFLLFPKPGNRRAQSALVPFVEAARAAGCRHVVYVSVFGADKLPLPHAKVEQAIRDSGMTWTILRCGFFMQNLHRALSSHGVDIAERGELFLPAGRSVTTWLHAHDVAAVAALALLHPHEHRNAEYHLTGGQRLSMNATADILSGALERPVRYTRPGLLRFWWRLRRRGIPTDTLVFMSTVYTLARFGKNAQLTNDITRLLGRPPRTVACFARDNAWRWTQRQWT